MSYRPIVKNLTYQVQLVKTFRKEWCLLSLDQSCVSLIFEKETIQIKNSDLTINTPLQEDYLLNLSKKIQISIPTFPFDLRSSLIMDLHLQQINYNISPTLQGIQVYDMLANKNVSIYFLQNMLVLAKYENSSEYMILNLNCFQHIGIIASDNCNRVGFKLLERDDFYYNEYSFSNSQAISDFTNQLRSLINNLQIKSIHVSEYKQYAQDQIKIDCVFRAQYYNKAKIQQKQCGSEFLQVTLVSKPYDCLLFLSEHQLMDSVFNESLGEFNYKQLNQNQIQLLQQQNIYSNVFNYRIISNIIISSDISLENEQLSTNIQNNEKQKTMSQNITDDLLQSQMIKDGKITKEEIQIKQQRDYEQKDEYEEKINNQKTILIEFVTGEKVCYLFENAEEMQVCVSQLLHKAAVNYYPINIKYYISNPVFKINTFSLIPVNFQGLDYFTYQIANNYQNIMKNIMILLESHPKSLQFEGKQKEIIQYAVQQLTGNEIRSLVPTNSQQNKILVQLQKRNEQLVILGFLKLILTSKTLFRSIVLDSVQIVVPVLEQLIKANTSDCYLIASGLQVIRSMLSYQFIIKHELNFSQSTSGVSGINTTSQQYYWQFDNIFLSKAEREQQANENKQRKNYFTELDLFAVCAKTPQDYNMNQNALQLTTSYQNSQQNYQTKIKFESDNRIDLLEKKHRILPLIGQLIKQIDMQQNIFVINTLVSIIEDITITRSHIGQRYYLENVTKFIKDKQNLQKQLLPQPTGRNELLMLMYDYLPTFINLSTLKHTTIYMAVTMIIKALLFDKFFNLKIRSDIVQKLLASGALVSHLLFMCEQNNNSVQKIIATSFIGACYVIDQNIQSLIVRIFPNYFTTIAKKSLEQCELQVDEFLQINNPFAFNLEPFQEFAQLIHQSNYLINVVWDSQLCETVCKILQDIITDFKQNLANQKEISWNYDELRINLRGCSKDSYSQFDIDIGQIVLSSFINCGRDGLNDKIGADNSEEYQKQYYKKRLEMLKRFNQLGIKQQMELKQLQRYEQSISKEVKKNIGTLLIQNIGIKTPSDFYKQFFDKFISNAHDIPLKCACLYCIQMLCMVYEQQFENVQLLMQECVRSIKENDYTTVLYCLSLLECVGYQINPNDIQKRSYWVLYAKNDLLYYLCVKILPLILYENGVLDVSHQLDHHIDLIKQPCYGNLVSFALRFLIQCVKECSSTDINGIILVPTPMLYRIIRSQPVLSTLLGLLLVCWKSNKDYEIIDIENKIYNDDMEPDQSAANSMKDSQNSMKISSKKSFAMRSTIMKQRIKLDIDFYETIFTLTCNLIEELCKQSDAIIDFFVSAGFIEFALANPLSVKPNLSVFKMLRQMYSNSNAKQVIERLLPTSMINYMMQEKQSTPIAEIFCSHNYVTMNCIWTKQMRDHLQDSVKYLVSALSQALQVVYQYETEQQMHDAQYFIEQNQAFIPMMQFDQIDQHPIVQNWPFITNHSQYCINGVYIDLIDIYTFALLFQETTSLQIHENNKVEIKQRDSKVLKSLDQLIKDRHSQMLLNIEQQLNLKESVSILYHLFEIHENTTIAQLEQLYQENGVNKLGDIYQNYYQECATFILSICLKKIHDEIQLCSNLFKEESDIREQMKQFTIKTGGSGNAIIQNDNIKHPDELRKIRLNKINVIFRYFSCVALIFRACNYCFEYIIKNIQQVQIRENIVSLLNFSQNLVSLNYEDNINKIVQLSEDYVGDSDNDVQIINNCKFIYKKEQQQLIKNQFALTSNMLYQCATCRSCNINYCKCLIRMLTNINNLLDIQTYELLDDLFFRSVAIILQQSYEQKMPLTHLQDIADDNCVSDMFNNIIVSFSQVLKKLCYIGKNNKAYKMLTSYGLPLFMVRGVFDQKNVFADIMILINDYILNKETHDEDKLIFVLQEQVNQLFKKLLSDYVYESINNSKNSQLLIQKQQKQVYSGNIIYNEQIKNYLQEQVNIISQQIDITNVDIIQYVILQVNENIKIHFSITHELIINNFYINAIINKILISIIQQKQDTFFIDVNKLQLQNNFNSELENNSFSLQDFVQQLECFIIQYLEYYFKLDQYNYNQDLIQYDQFSQMFTQYTESNSYVFVPLLATLSLMNYIYLNNKQCYQQFLYKLEDQKQSKNLINYLFILSIQQTGSPCEELIAEIAFSMVNHAIDSKVDFIKNLKLFNLQTNEENQLIINNNVFLLYNLLFANQIYIQIQQYSTQSLVNAEQATFDIFEKANYELYEQSNRKLVAGFYKIVPSNSLLNRQCCCLYLFQKINSILTKQQQIMYIEVVCLFLLIQNIGAIQHENPNCNNQFYFNASSSINILSTLCIKSAFLKQFVPPYILAKLINQSYIELFQAFENPEFKITNYQFVWNNEIASQFKQIISKLHQQLLQIITNTQQDYQNDQLQLDQYYYNYALPYLMNSYQEQNLVCNNVYIQLYNESCNNNKTILADAYNTSKIALQYINTNLVLNIQQQSNLYIIYIRFVNNILKNHHQIRQLIVNTQEFKFLICQLLFNSQLCSDQNEYYQELFKLLLITCECNLEKVLQYDQILLLLYQILQYCNYFNEQQIINVLSNQYQCTIYNVLCQLNDNQQLIHQMCESFSKLLLNQLNNSDTLRKQLTTFQFTNNVYLTNILMNLSINMNCMNRNSRLNLITGLILILLKSNDLRIEFFKQQKKNKFETYICACKAVDYHFQQNIVEELCDPMNINQDIPIPENFSQVSTQLMNVKQCATMFQSPSQFQTAQNQNIDNNDTVMINSAFQVFNKEIFADVYVILENMSDFYINNPNSKVKMLNAEYMIKRNSCLGMEHALVLLAQQEGWTSMVEQIQQGEKK